MPVRLRIWPTRVMRGLIGLPAAKATRNLRTRVALLDPDRASRIKIGLPESNLIAKEANKRIGAKRMRAMVAKMMSTTRLVHWSRPMTGTTSSWIVARATRATDLLLSNGICMPALERDGAVYHSLALAISNCDVTVANERPADWTVLAATPMKAHDAGSFSCPPLCLTGMCRIIGRIDREAAAPHLIDALARLEYRGYDSAGSRRSKTARLRRRGQKLKNLDSRLEHEPLKGTIASAAPAG
jgi:hypothetical protein